MQQTNLLATVVTKEILINFCGNFYTLFVLNNHLICGGIFGYLLAGSVDISEVEIGSASTNIAAIRCTGNETKLKLHV